MLPDRRFEGDRHYYCPSCAVVEPFVQQVLRTFNGLKAGLALQDVAPEPSDALIAAVALVDREVGALDAQRMKDRSPRTR